MSGSGRRRSRGLEPVPVPVLVLVLLVLVSPGRCWWVLVSPVLVLVVLGEDQVVWSDRMFPAHVRRALALRRCGAADHPAPRSACGPSGSSERLRNIRRLGAPGELGANRGHCSAGSGSAAV